MNSFSEIPPGITLSVSGSASTPAACICFNNGVSCTSGNNGLDSMLAVLFLFCFLFASDTKDAKYNNSAGGETKGINMTLSRMETA